MGKSPSLLLVASVVWAAAVAPPWSPAARAATAAPDAGARKEEKGAKKEDAKKDDVKKDDAKKDDAKKAPAKKDPATNEPKKDLTASKSPDPVKEPPADKDGKKEAKEGKPAASAAASKSEGGATKKSETSTPPRPGPSAGAAAKDGDKAPSDKEEAAGPITPPIKLSTMREEMNRPPRKEERPLSRAEREKLEQLAAEINKAREGMRQETARLEALLAARDAAQPASSNNNTNSAADGAAETGKKVQTPLDSLAKAMRGMKPEQAAPIISRVDRKLGADVLLRMPAVDAGKVMGVCSPQVAAELTAEIASRQPHAELKR